VTTDPGDEAPDAERPSDPRKKFVFDESLRALGEQAGRRDELRSRAGNIFAASAVATGFLGAEAFKADSTPRAWAWTAAVAFVVTGLAAVYVLLPTSWAFTNDVGRLQTEWVDQGYSLDTMYAGLAGYHDENLRSNEPKLRWRARAVTVAAVALVVDILALLIDVSQRF
jgi:hypothetical protein